MYNNFTTKVDIRSRKAMAEFLANHFRYNTMNSWNRSTAWANNMKIYNLGLEKEIDDKLFDLLDVDTDELHFTFDNLISEFEKETGYTAGFNGRSGGYLVMYEFTMEPTGYKSFCTECGQRNYQTIEESKSCKCGRCGADARINYGITPMRKVVYPGRSIDDYSLEEYMDKEYFSMEDLKEKVKFVQRFDQLCNDIVTEAIYYATEFEVVEKEIQVPKKIKVLKVK